MAALPPLGGEECTKSECRRFRLVPPKEIRIHRPKASEESPRRIVRIEFRCLGQI